MRWTLLIALMGGLLFATRTPAQETPQAPPKPTKTPTSLPTPKAEPENAQMYGPVVSEDDNQPTAADIGPAQKHFVLASATDHLAETQNDDNASLAIREKITLDKRISIPKIHDVLDNGPGSGGDNNAMRYEVTYLNWGAVTAEQMRARYGHYFTVTWDNDGPKADFTARFEYRQVKSKEVVRTLTQTMPHVSGATRSYFGVVNNAYLAYGPVVSWRFTVLKGDTVVAEAKSFIW